MEKILLILFRTIWILKACETLLPYPHGDALYYHLAGPKIWYFDSWKAMWIDVEPFLNGGIFDFLYIWPFFFTSSLLKGQVLGQLTHFFFSLGLGSWLLVKTIPHRSMALLAGIALLTLSRDAAFFLYAKNDGVVALTTLLLAITVLQTKKSFSRGLFVGFLMGLVVAVKMNGLISILPISLTLLIQDWKKSRPYLGGVILCGAIVTSLVFLKNFLLTGNPFFPALTSLIPGNLSEPTLDHYNRFYGNPVTLTTLSHHVRDFFTGKFLFLLAPLLLFLRPKEIFKGINQVYLWALGTFGIYLLYNGGLPHARYFFACYFLTVFFLFGKLSQINIPKKGVILLLLITLADSKIDKTVKHIREAWSGHTKLSEKEFVRREIPMTQLWDFIHPISGKEKTLILSDELTNQYYLPLSVRLHSSVQTTSAAFLVKCDQEGDLEKLKRYDYALLGRNLDNPCTKRILQKGKFLGGYLHYKVFQIF